MTTDSITSANDFQKKYFEDRVPLTMIPEATAYVLNHVEKALLAAKYQAGERVMEVGAGMGRFTLPILEQGVQIEAQDLSAVLIERLAQYNTRKLPIKLWVGDLHAPEPALHNQYDLIIGFFMLHHLADLTKAFAGMAKMLKPNGRMVFIEPNPYNPLYYIQMLINPGMSFNGDRGILKMRYSLLSKCAKNLGLIDFTLKRYGFFPPFLKNKPFFSALETPIEKIPFLNNFLPFQTITMRK